MINKLTTAAVVVVVVLVAFVLLRMNGLVSLPSIEPIATHTEAPPAAQVKEVKKKVVSTRLVKRLAPLEPQQLAPDAPDAPDAPVPEPRFEIVEVPIVVEVYDTEAKAELKLPQHIQDDESVEVLAATRVEPDYNPVLVTSIFDVDTGKVTTFTKREPAAWLGFRQRASIGLYYGLKINPLTSQSGVVGRAIVTYDFLQVKRIDIGATLSVDTDGEVFGGLGLRFAW